VAQPLRVFVQASHRYRKECEMKPLPTDPAAFQARVFAAFADDLFDIGAGRSKSCERTEALRQISIQSTREAGGANNAPASNNG
jgi:hypothetical protein